MIRLASRRKRITMLDMTPLVDVVFLLLIFFLLTSTSMQRSMDIDLQETRSGTAQATRPLMITILPDESLRLDREPVALSELLPMLQERFAGKAKRTLTIEADRSVSFGIFAQVLDLAKQAHAEEINLATAVIRDATQP